MTGWPSWLVRITRAGRIRLPPARTMWRMASDMGPRWAATAASRRRSNSKSSPRSGSSSASLSPTARAATDSSGTSADAPGSWGRAALLSMCTLRISVTPHHPPDGGAAQLGDQGAEGVSPLFEVPERPVAGSRGGEQHHRAGPGALARKPDRIAQVRGVNDGRRPVLSLEVGGEPPAAWRQRHDGEDVGGVPDTADEGSVILAAVEASGDEHRLGAIHGVQGGDGRLGD